MVTSLIKHERIVTTVPKAKELRTLADKVIGYAKKGNMASQQRAMRIIREKPACTKLFDVLGPRYIDRDGGYTRVMKLSQTRKGDNAVSSIYFDVFVVVVCCGIALYCFLILNSTSYFKLSTANGCY